MKKIIYLQDEKNIFQKSALPCPFCGGNDLQFISDVDGDRDVEFIVCMNSDCLCDGRIGKNKEEALSRWNTRHCL